MRDQFNRVACDLRQTFLERTLDRDLTDLEKETVGDLMSRTVGDITEVVDTVMVTINEGWDTWLLMISYFIVKGLENKWDDMRLEHQMHFYSYWALEVRFPTGRIYLRMVFPAQRLE